jgi:hypothetical protein
MMQKLKNSIWKAGDYLELTCVEGQHSASHQNLDPGCSDCKRVNQITLMTVENSARLKLKNNQRGSKTFQVLNM